MLITIKSILAETKSELVSSGIETDDFELRLLLSAATDTDIKTMPRNQMDISREQFAKFKFMISERKQHKPVDKILGYRGFYKYDFSVSTDVLTPRPDTEILVENAIKAAQNNNYNHILELGVGSGCIIISILAELKHADGEGVDISPQALQIAQRNAENIGVSSRIKLRCADWFDNDFNNNFNRKFDLIVSNPPYINTNEIKTLAREVSGYDPMLALDGGSDGLASYRRIAEIAPLLLETGGMLFLEIGEGQEADVINIFSRQGLYYEQSFNDLSGIQRCITFKK